MYRDNEIKKKKSKLFEAQIFKYLSGCLSVCMGELELSDIFTYFSGY